MKQMYMLFFGLLVLILAGCSDHDWVDTNTDKPVKVTAQIAKSRVGFNEVDNITNAYWQEGDAITLFTSSQGNLDYVAGASAGSSSSKAFTPRSGYLKAIDGEQVLACYPASTIEDGKVSLPITTDWEDNDPMPFAYAVSSIEDSEVNLQFEHVFSFLKLTVTPSMLSDTTKAVRQLIVRTSSGAPLSIGEGSTFDYSTKEASIANGENTIQIATDTKVVRTSWEVYLPVLPQPAEADITITLADEAGEILFELTKKTPSTGLEKGNVYRVGTSISYDTSFLIDGPTFNTRIKQLANDADITYTNADSLIRKIEFVTDTELMTFLDDCIEVSSGDSPCPIYASFNSTERLLTVFTPAKDIEIENASYMFYGFASLQSIDFGNFDVNEKTVTTSNMFSYCYSLNEVDVSGWDTSNVTDMRWLFYGCSSLSNLDVSGWKTGNVTSMYSLFCDCSSLTALDVSQWSTEKVTEMCYTFYNCSSLDDLDVSRWETGNVTTMESMFERCSSLSNLNVSGWDTSNVTDMRWLFYGCSSLKDLDVSSWKTENVTSMQSMFYDCYSLTDLDVSNWDTSNVTDMRWLFYGCSALTGLDVSGWKTGNVTSMYSLFCGCSSLTALDVSQWSTEKVTEMCYTFDGCSSLSDLDVSSWETENVTTMHCMFYECSLLTTLDVSQWNTSNVTDMAWMFSFCPELTTLDVSQWNTGKVTNMHCMFQLCSSLTDLDVSNWNTGSVTNMDRMFLDCESLINLSVSNWAVEHVTTMHLMFGSCFELTNLDVSNWVITDLSDVGSMFKYCLSLTTIDASNWDTQNVTAMDSLFLSCLSLENLNISKWIFNDNTDVGDMFADCASSSQACKVTSSFAAKDFLLSRTETTSMNPDWFFWEIAAGDGSSFDDIPKQEWRTTLRSRTSSIKTERMKDVNKAKRTSSKSIDENGGRLSSDHSRPHLPLSFHDSNYRIRKY